MFVPPQPMTLRRFVRVTIDNFRQLIQSYATPVATLPMADSHLSTPAGSPHDGEAAHESTGAPAPAELHRSAHEPAPETSDLPTAAAGDAAQDAADSPSGRDEMTAQSVDLVEPFGDAAPLHAGDGEDGEIAPPAAAIEPLSDVPVEADEAPAGEAAVAEPDRAPVSAALALDAALESLLFVAEEPLEPGQAARVFGLSADEVEAALQALDAAYREQRRGLRIQVRNGRYQLVTAPEAAGLIETFLNLDTSSKLSGPALETLAVVAYRQPVTRAQIEAVRGVDCSGVLRSLLQRGLVEEVGRMEAPGRPVLYGVSDLFMRHFGLTGLHELPPLANEENSRIDDIIAVEENPPAV